MYISAAYGATFLLILQTGRKTSYSCFPQMSRHMELCFYILGLRGQIFADNCTAGIPTPDVTVSAGARGLRRGHVLVRGRGHLHNGGELLLARPNRVQAADVMRQEVCSGRGERVQGGRTRRVRVSGR